APCLACCSRQASQSTRIPALRFRPPSLIRSATASSGSVTLTATILSEYMIGRPDERPPPRARRLGLGDVSWWVISPLLSVRSLRYDTIMGPGGQAGGGSPPPAPPPGPVGPGAPWRSGR